MSIAIQAIVIFALVLPGIILRRSYRRGLTDTPPAIYSAADEIAVSLLYACFLHAIYAGIVHRWIWPIDLDAVARILLGNFGDRSVLLGQTIAAVTTHPYRVFGYFASLNAFAFAIGHLLHRMVRLFDLDWRYSFFRLERWRYLLPDTSIAPE